MGPLTTRQKQALRGLHALDVKHPGVFHSCGQIAHPVRGELPTREQHGGRGAMGKKGWSGTVPLARYMAGAVRTLVRLGLAEELPRREWSEWQRSGTYRITEKGREEHRALEASGTLMP